jgi:hypothetical protein
MATGEQRNYSKSYLKKAEEYVASAEDNLAAARHTPAAGDAIHAGISSKDAIVPTLTGSARRPRPRDGCEGTEAGLGEETRSRNGREGTPRVAFGERRCGVRRRARDGWQGRVTRRRARTLVDLAVHIVRLGR